MKNSTVLLAVLLLLTTVFAQEKSGDDAQPPKQGKPEQDKQEKKTPSREKSKWLFIYWMPYDNNLDHCGRPILKMLADGVRSPEVSVVVQADFKGKGGMKRFVITSGGTEETSLEDVEGSADEKTYGEYLDWVHRHFEAEKYAAVFLDHGGVLDRLCLDEYPRRGFFQTKKLSDKIADFNSKTGCKLELLFLQVCAKSSIEPLYEFRKTARYTLASEFPIGAPNYYYTAVMDFVGENPEAKGNEVARRIVQHDRLSMYRSFTCIDNSKFDEFAKLLDDFIESIKEKEKLQVNPKRVMSHAYANEPYFDLLSLMAHLDVGAEIERGKLHPLISFVKTQLIDFHISNPESMVYNFSGLSVTVPPVKEKYTCMSIYKETGLLKLMNKLEVGKE